MHPKGSRAPIRPGQQGGGPGTRLSPNDVVFVPSSHRSGAPHVAGPGLEHVPPAFPVAELRPIRLSLEVLFNSMPNLPFSLATFPSSVFRSELLSLIPEAQGRLAEAVSLLEAAAKLRPNRALIQKHLGEARRAG